MSFLVSYIRSSLAATGLCVFDQQIAFMTRPDLWQIKTECQHDFSSRYAKGLAGAYVHDGSQTCHAQIEGIGRTKVFYRSADQLAQRIEWLTGMAVTSIDNDVTPEALAQPGQTDPLQRRDPGDVFAELATKEAGRPCGTCENLSSGSSCIRHLQSGIRYPAMNVMRRCPAYQPLHTQADGRNGLALWPEIAQAPRPIANVPL